MPRTLILGAGFGGITVATELRRRLGDDHEIVLVDRAERFSMGLRKLWELVGIGTIADGSRPRKALADLGIDVRRQTITAVDPADRAATLDGGETVEADTLVVALGAEARPDLVDGLADHALDVWRKEHVAAAHETLERFDGGTLAVVIAGAPYTCPPAPYECAMLLDEHLRERGLRDETELLVTTFQPILLPNAGKEGSAWLARQLEARGIGHQTGRKVERVEAGRVVYEDGDLPFELAIGVPPHRPPKLVAESPLAGEGGWIAVDHGTLETGFDGVYAVGDVTAIKLANGLPLPKAGLMAELEGERVAAAIAACQAGAAEPPPFDGRGFCFLEMGEGSAALIDGDFYGDPEPRVVVREPTAEAAADKRRFEAERLERWFGAAVA